MLHSSKCLSYHNDMSPMGRFTLSFFHLCENTHWKDWFTFSTRAPHHGSMGYPKAKMTFFIS